MARVPLERERGRDNRCSPTVLAEFRRGSVPRRCATDRGHSRTEREKGARSEKLTRASFQNGGRFHELCRDARLFSDRAERHGHNARDPGTDPVATPEGSKGSVGFFHPIQSKTSAPEATLRREDIDSFFTASGKKHFSLRHVVATTNPWSHHAEEAMAGRAIPVQKMDPRETDCGALLRS